MKIRHSLILLILPFLGCIAFAGGEDPSNDTCSSAILLTVLDEGEVDSGEFFALTDGANASNPSERCGVEDIGLQTDVWYKIVAAQKTKLTIHISDDTPGAFVELFSFGNRSLASSTSMAYPGSCNDWCCAGAVEAVDPFPDDAFPIGLGTISLYPLSISGSEYHADTFTTYYFRVVPSPLDDDGEVRIDWEIESFL